MIPETIRKNAWVQLIFWLLTVSSLLLFGYVIRDILLTFFLSFLMAYILDPLVDWFENSMNWSRTLSIVVIFTAVTIIMLLLGYYLTFQALQITQELNKLVQDPPDIGNWLESVLPTFLQNRIERYYGPIGSQKFLEKVFDLLQQYIASITKPMQQGSNIIIFFVARTVGVIQLLLYIFVFIFVTIYILHDFDQYLLPFNRVVPLRYRELWNNIWAEIDTLLRAYFRGHLTVSLTIGVLYGTGYMSLGLTGGFLIGFISGLMNILPYIGPTLGCVAALSMALYQFGFSYWVLGVLAVFVAVQSLEGNILTPQIVGEAVGLDPVSVIFALMVFARLFGFIGLIFAIPATAILKIFAENLWEEYRSSEFYRKKR